MILKKEILVISIILTSRLEHANTLKDKNVIEILIVSTMLNVIIVRRNVNQDGSSKKVFND